jgi:nicotinamide-nucleotide adenylyltransferase
MAFTYGMVHGRFQPFHAGHLEYAKKAAERSRHLFIGITNPDPSTVVPEASDPERHLAVNNPFTFFERMMMVRAALADEGFDPHRYSIIPFPIHHPERWFHYFPPETVQFVRVFSGWGQEKVERLRAAGLRVEVLDAGREKAVSGAEVRARLRAGADWDALVPPAVARVLREIGGEEKARSGARFVAGRLRSQARRQPPAQRRMKR